MKRTYFFVLILALSFCANAQVKLSNGLSYKIQTAPGKAANYQIVDVGKWKAEVTQPSRYIVKFKSDPELKAKLRNAKPTTDQDHMNFMTDLNRIEDNHLRKNGNSLSRTKIHHHFKSAFNGKAITAIPAIVEELKKLSYVHSVVEDKQIKLSDVTSNAIIEADKVWSQLNITGKGVVIGIIDTGIDYNHPEIGDGFGPGHKVIGGYDFANDDNDPMDDHGHGTHVSGIAAANGPTLKGVAPDAKLMAFKVLTNQGWGFSSWIIAGIERCVDPDQNPDTDDKVDVVNMSLGGPTNGPDPMSEAVDNAVLAGIVFAVAAGNNGDYQTIGSPGIAQLAITVGATDSNDILAYFSSKGPSADNYALKPDICAPGVNIYSSLFGGNYASWSGTSMATPHVTGAAALLLQLHPDWTPEQVKAALMQNATPLYGNPFEVGSGRLDVLKSANATFTVTPGSISFGILDKSQAVVSKTFQLTVSNFSNQQKTLSINPTGDLNDPAIVTTIDKTSLTLSAGASQVINVSLAIQTANLVFKDIPNLYFGFVNVSDNSTSIKVPVGFVNPETIHLQLDQPFPALISISGTDNYFFKYVFPTSTDIDIPLPIGHYNITALYGDWTYLVAKENISVPSGSPITVSMSEASNAIAIQPLNENGEILTFQPGSLGTTSIGLNQGSGFGIYYGGLMDTLHLSTLSPNWHIAFLTNDVPIQAPGKLYALGSSMSGVSQSLSLSNNPADLIPVKYHYDQDLNSTIDLTGTITNRPSPYFAWSIFNIYPRRMPSGFTEFHQKVEKPDDGSLITTQQYIDAGLNTGYSFQTPQLSIYKNDSVVFYKGILQNVSETKYLATPSLDLQLNETLLQWGAATANDDAKVVLNPFFLDGYFVNNRGDKVLGKVVYSLSNNSGLVRKDSVINPRQGSGYIDEENLTPGSYTLKLNFTDYQVRGKYGRATCDLNFNTSNDDKNPPYLNKFELKVNGQLVNQMMPGETATLALSVTDDCYPFNFPCNGTNSGVAAYYVQYKKLDDSVWTDLLLINDNANFPTNMQEGYYSLKFYSIDNSGNSFIYTLEPAFTVGLNPNPIPFRRPGLISPENHAALVPQNTSFKWTSIENATQYHFQVSADSSFATLFRSLNTPNDSIKLDTLLQSQKVYYWRVQAQYTNSASPWSEPFSFTTGTGVDNPVQLLAPADNSIGLPAFNVFQWTKNSNSSGYEIQWADQTNTNSYDTQINDTTFGAYLLPGKNWVWRVRTVSPSIIGEWTSSFRFSTKLPTLSPLYPQDQAVEVPVATPLSWSDDFFSGSYRIQVSTSDDFSAIVADIASINSTYYQLPQLQSQTTYYWRVQANYYPDVSVWSEVWSFRTKSEGAADIALFSPANLSVNQGLTSVFAWQYLPSESGYKLMLSGFPDFSNARTIWTSVPQVAVDGLLPLTMYYWRVQGTTDANVSTWSDVWTFQTQSLNITLLSPADNSNEQGLTGVFEWQPLPINAEYKLMLSLSSGFPTATTTTTTTSASHANFSSLQPLTTYYWKVGTNYQGTDYWSDAFSFRTAQILGTEPGRSINIFPNPASSSVSFQFSSSENHKVTMMNSLGQQVWAFEGNAQEVAWQTSSLPNGIYFALIEDGDVAFNTKIVIQR